MAYFTRYLHPFLHNWRYALIQIGALVTFALIPLWDRFPTAAPPPLLLARLHVSYFAILLPLLWTVGCWLAFGLPGFAALRCDPLRRGWALCLLALALWALLSQSWAFMRVEDPETGANAALQFSLAALFAVAIASAGPPPRAVVAVMAAVLVLNSVIAILQAAAQGSIGVTALGEFQFDAAKVGISVVQAGDIRWVRPMGLMPHPNLLAGSLLVGLLASCGLLLSRRGWLRWLGTGIFALGLWALLLTFSRGAWLGFAAGCFAVLPLLRPFLRRHITRLQLGVAAGIMLALGVAFGLAYRPLLAARAGAGTESTELRSVSDRIVFAEFAGRSITERPALGVGMGNFPWRTSYYLVETTYDLRGDNVHHVYLLAWAELGVVGAGLLLAALIAGIEGGLRAIKTHAAALLRSASEKPIVRAATPGERETDCSRDMEIENLAGRVALMAVVMALIIAGLLDHYPWTLLHFQIAWWGSMAVMGRKHPVRS